MMTSDSAAAHLLDGAGSRYAALKNKVLNSSAEPAGRLREYIPRVDSLETALKFLSQGGLPPARIQQLQAISRQLRTLQSKLQTAREIQDFAGQREQQLQAQLSQYHVGDQLLSVNKDVYYYQQRLSQYKSLLNDRQKMEQTILSAVSRMPAFKNYLAKNGMLAQLFPTGSGFGNSQTLAGLQTSAQVQAMISQRIGGTSKGGAGSSEPGADGAAGGGPDPLQFIDQQAQAAQSDMDKLKEKLRQMGNGAGNTNMTMPAFTPNSQKTRTFWRRLEFGANIQNTPSSTSLPVTSSLALTAGYRISDKATAGLGASYNFGWGKGLDHIQLSNQGVGLRSYLDIKAKGSIWITGGYEYNYLQQFARLTDIRNLDVWQKSALLGLTKKYKIGKRGGNVQLLYDFFAGSQVPRAAPLKFRIGYSL
jgi:hypothetical protein